MLGTKQDWQDRLKNIRIGRKGADDTEKSENLKMSFPIFDKNLYIVNEKNDSESRGSVSISILDGLIAGNTENSSITSYQATGCGSRIVGVGFKARAESEGRLLYLKLGYSHEVELTVLPAVRVFCFKNNVVCCTGINKQRVHQFAAAVRSCKPPEVYKGKGIMYIDEVIKKRAGKKSK
ncbi:hypothetical protein ACJRO7_030793 [Eucalyptus globulus]|uniref:Large ribosomal subunit protein uL6 alpha-beta domain-containing protein n=1 Tax=Eucalyptus globulus TaxID=34317 RepID=A0ABD3JNH0_EUCGL